MEPEMVELKEETDKSKVIVKDSNILLSRTDTKCIQIISKDERREHSQPTYLKWHLYITTPNNSRIQIL